MHKVIKTFFDLQDDNRLYKEGDTYPREGLKPSPERIRELSGNENKVGAPLIKAMKKPARKKAQKK